MVTDKEIQEVATFLNVSVAAIKAVKDVESSGSGFINGVPKILFEPHVFWKELRKRSIDPNTIKGYEDILYPVWGTKRYGKESEQWGRLQKAITLNKDAALSSASWGLFQILGNNWETTKVASLDDFVSNMSESEDKQLELFSIYIKTSHLDDELRNKDWKGFARSYNGALYYKNNYDKKLASAFLKYS